MEASGGEQRESFGGAGSVLHACQDDRPPRPGAELRRAREAKQLSIEDLSRTTKIRPVVLTALEDGRVESLPAEIYTRGFLKAYAREVGLDPNAVADRYLSKVELISRAPAPEPAATPTHRRATRAEVLALDDETTKVIAAQQARRLGRTLTTVVVFGLAAYIWSFNWQRLASPPTTTPTQSVAPASSDVARASDSSAAPPTPSAAIDVPQGPLQFELRPQGPCWLVANVDGSPVLARLLQAGESQTIEVHDELLLRVGDPAALSFSINGQSGRPLGRQGEPVNVRITRANFRDFLSS